MAEKKRSYRNGYRGRQSGRAKGKKPIGRSAKVRDKRQLIIVVSMVAAVVLLAVGAYFIFFVGGGDLTPEKKAEILASGTFEEGVCIEGVDVSGMTYAQAEPLVVEKREIKLSELSIKYSVDGQEYALDSQMIGAQIDYQPIMEQALFYGKDGTKSENREAKRTAKRDGVNFPLIVQAENSALQESLEQQGLSYNTPMKNAEIVVNTVQDEDTLQLNGTLSISKESAGREVNDEKLMEEILQALAADNLQNVIEAEVVETQPTLTQEQLEENCQLMASYTTRFKDSKYERRYNIWRMGTVVNGVVLQPGEEWSINDAAGPRTSETGWKNAAGISDGQYVDEPGGGICQVSSTLYIALIKSEVEIVTRSHHSWPLSYVPTGLDATISTGGPDFVYRNNYDTPIAVVVTVDGKDERSITVKVYGPKMDYDVRFEVEEVKNEEPQDSPAITMDPELEPGETEWVKPRHNYIQVQVWKIKEDKDSGEQIGERELFSTETYRAFTGTVAVAPSPSPSPSPSLSPSPSISPSEGAESEPAPPLESGAEQP